MASAAFTQTPTMKTPSLLFIALTLATPAFCQDAPATGSPEGSLKAKAAARLELLLETPGPRLLERFDANKDGSLSEDEKAKAREAIKARATEAAGKARAKFDADGDGTLNDAERAKAREAIKGKVGGAIRQRILQRFDEDKDGKLNDAERAKAKAAGQERAAKK